MGESKQQVLHRAEEHGQSRELKTAEVKAHAVMAAVESLSLASAAGIAVVTVQGIQGYNLSIWSPLAAGCVVGGLSFYFHVSRNFADLQDGLRSWRSVETFIPPVSQPEQVAVPASPIVVRPYNGDPYILTPGDERPALPDGRQTALGLNPPTLSAILKEVLTNHGGQWSRQRLMSIRINGERVPRWLYEQMTSALVKSGFLLPKPTGGYELPPDVQEFDDLGHYLPGLLTGKAGGKAGRREPTWKNGSQPASRELTAAERHRLAHFEELDYSVQCYLKGKKKLGGATC